MGGSGILPTCIHKNKLYFLFGKENRFDNTPGWCDFGGGKEKSETFMKNALREGTEELTGFLGSEKELEKMLKKHGTYNVHFDSGKYRIHIFPFEYDEKLPFYYNNNQRFLQKKLEPSLIKNSRIFEKAEIKWVCVDDIPKMRSQFRSYFQDVADDIYNQKNDIYSFINKSKRETKNKTRKNR
jgi:hypothetical protein